MKKFLFLLTTAILLCGFILPSAQAAQVSGAIFTTNGNGAIVNANIYSSKCEVYLDGGPGPHAPASAAGLPDGQYYFQVTDPSGKQLLSTDVVSNRSFIVTNGVITSYVGFGGPTHPTGYDQDHPELGAITIRVGNASCPTDYKDSPNGGGTYKVWATPAADFVGDPAAVDNTCGNGCFHGFVPSKSKTDNFKASVGTSTFCLTLWKRFIVNGIEGPGAQWKFTVTDPVPVENAYYTGSDGFLRICGLTTGRYTVREDMEFPWMFSLLLVNGVQDSTPQPNSNSASYTFVWSPGQPEPVVIFKNSKGDVIPLD